MSGHTKLGFTLLGGELGTLGQRSYHSDDWLVWIVAIIVGFSLAFCSSSSPRQDSKA